ncbi:MAG TPA: methyl-accepting chemotaxis protein [Spirochaetota bacterium]|nr:methyl-accepting chemotaxis protein [Spirochaetota bacterium]HPJ44326.1 methyl-accepting chemotaxis protein [Spirochaetota bacterium]HPR39079.1 methyl-accepting chemotaxis protein [Spirochaetota bacterium]HRX48322.1 methyl-accepting chemotaxis protein [Spirochaetota bacterium]
MKSLRLKVIMLTLGTGLGVLILIIGISIFSINKYSRQLLDMNKNAIFNDYDKNVKNQVENVISLLESVKKYQTANNLTDAQGKNLARELVRGLKYNKTGYFWIDDFEGVNACNPPDPSIEGKSRIGMQDVNGKFLIKEIIENGRQPEGGFTDYWFPKPGETKADRKRSYSKSFEPYRWVTGTGNYVDDIEKVVTALEEENRAYIRTLLLTVIAIGAGISVIIIILSIFFGNSIARPVIETAKVANRLADGDLTSRIDPKFAERNDEVGTLVTSINTANEKLEQMITSIISAMQNLYYATEQISAGNQNLSQRTTEQASSLEEIASTIEETTATITQNTDNARHANTTSIASYEFAEKGGDLVNSAVSSINEISESSKKIGEIISVINEIAFQTNLLALNAAVEAARAGEQGRGFAVVAGEVRNLAQRSGTAAKQIGELIRESIDKIAKGTEQANHSGEAIKEIINSVKNVTQLISEITAASDEQKSGIDQINTAIMELDNMTQQNAALVEETASASEEMASQALELMNMTKVFKIDSGNESIKKQEGEIPDKSVAKD